MHVCCLTRITLGHEVKGGMEVHVDTLARALAARGHQVSIVTSAHPEGIECETEGAVTTWYLDGCRPGKYSHEWGAASNDFLRGLHRSRPIDLIWGEGAGAYYYVKRYRKPLPVPVVTFLQGTYLGEVGTSLSLARFMGEWRQFLNYLPLRTIQYFRWDLWYTHGAEAVIGASRQNAALARWGYLLPRRRVTASVNGVDPQLFRPDPEAGAQARGEMGIPAEVPLLLHCSRLVPEKGPQFSIQTLKRIEVRFPRAQLLVAGEGRQRATLERQADAAGLTDRVTFAGQIDNRLLPGLYNACDVFLCPTIAVESFGITVAEAMACGRPVVAFGRGGIRTSIDSADTGIIVPAGDTRKLAGETASLLADPGRRERLGFAARRKAAESLSVDRMTADVQQVFEDAVRVH